MSWEKVVNDQLYDYARVFTEYFSTILTKNEKYISVNIYRNIASHYCAVEFIFQDTEPEVLMTEYNWEQNVQINFVSKFMLNKVNDMFYQIKDVIEFSENSFYILKTDEYKNWHPAMAKLDLADVLDSILAGNEVDE